MPGVLLSFNARVTGSVQGVGFRAWTAFEARRLDLAGYVRNLPDGSVEVEASGGRERLEELLALLESGPPGASVDLVAVEWSAAPARADAGPTRFEVRH